MFFLSHFSGSRFSRGKLQEIKQLFINYKQGDLVTCYREELPLFLKKYLDFLTKILYNIVKKKNRERKEFYANA